MKSKTCLIAGAIIGFTIGAMVAFIVRVEVTEPYKDRTAPVTMEEDYRQYKDGTDVDEMEYLENKH